MKLKNLWMLVLIVINLTILHTQAADLAWTSDDNQLSITVKPNYDPNSHSLTQAIVTLTDNSLVKINSSISEKPYVYPPFIFIFTPLNPGNSPSQSVAAIAGEATANGSLEFRTLESSHTDSFLFINFYYGTETVQTKSAQGSIIKIPLTDSSGTNSSDVNVSSPAKSSMSN
jgi:hypothetical protein